MDNLLKWKLSKNISKIRRDGWILYKSNGSACQSVLRYTARSDHQFGQLYCWARNSMGLMAVPCVFSVIPATPPDPPLHCAVTNQTTEVLQVR